MSLVFLFFSRLFLVLIQATLGRFFNDEYVTSERPTDDFFYVALTLGEKKEGFVITDVISVPMDIFSNRF